MSTYASMLSHRARILTWSTAALGATALVVTAPGLGGARSTLPEAERGWSSGPLLLAGAMLGALLLTWLGLSILRLRRSQAMLASGLAAGELRHHRLLQNLGDGFMLHEVLRDANGVAKDSRILQVNPAFEKITGLSAHRLVGKLASAALSGDDHHWAEVARRVVLSGRPESYEHCSEKNGRRYAVRVYAPQHDQFAVVLHDVGAHRQQAKAAASRAQYDPLTGLPDRTLLADRLGQAILQAERRGERVAVCRLNVGDFHGVSERHGRAAADALLVELAERLRNALRAGDSVARLSGDEFALLLTGIGSPETVDAALARVREALSQPLRVGAQSLTVTLAIDTTLFPRDGATPIPRWAAAVCPDRL